MNQETMQALERIAALAHAIADLADMAAGLRAAHAASEMKWRAEKIAELAAELAAAAKGAR